MAILEANHLSKQFGYFPALRDVSFSLEGGQIVGLLGPNGSGKTTLIKLAAGLLTPTSGEIRICGNAPGVATKAVTAYLPDRGSLPEDMKAGKLIRMMADFYQDFDHAKATAMVHDLGVDMNQPLKLMSKGTKEKMQLALTMSRQAKLYLLDEPIGGVDPAARDYILRTIISNYNEDAVVIISTHLIADIESVLDSALFIRDGSLLMYESVERIREERGQSVDGFFREVFKC